MTTPLIKSLRREIWIDGRAYTLTLTQTGLSISEKRSRKARVMMWKDLVSAPEREAGAMLPTSRE